MTGFLRRMVNAQLKPFPINGLMLSTYFAIGMTMGAIGTFVESEQDMPWALFGLLAGLLTLYLLQARIMHKSHGRVPA